MADEDKRDEQKPKDEQPEDGAKGTPDWERAAGNYRAQRDAARDKADELEKQLEELKSKVEGLKTAEDVQKAVDEALAKANADMDAAKADWAGREKALVLEKSLAQAGCIDAPALLAHVDLSKVEVKDGKPEGLDVKALSESYPYLFGKREQSGSTGARPDGAADGIGDAIDKAMGIAKD